MSILDDDISVLADAPSIEAWPSGSYSVKLSAAISTNNPERPNVQVFAELVDVLELANPTDAPPKAGDKALFNCSLVKKDGTPNELGQGQLKRILTPLINSGYPASTRACVNMIEQERPIVAVTIKTSINKSTGDKNSSVVSLAVMS